MVAFWFSYLREKIAVFSPRSNNTNNDNNEKYFDMTEEEIEMGEDRKSE